LLYTQVDTATPANQQQHCASVAYRRDKEKKQKINVKKHGNGHDKYEK